MDNSRIESIKKAIETKIGGNLEVKPVEVTKNNDLLFYGFTLVGDKEKLTASPTVYYNPEWEDDEIVSHVVTLFKDSLSNLPQFPLDNIRNKVNLLENIYPVLIGRANNSKILETAIWREFLDMAIIYKIKVRDSQKGLVGTITVNQSIAEYAGVVEHELYEAAFKNIENTGVVESLTEIIMKTQGIMLPPCDECDLGVYVVSNDSRMYGAAQVLSRKIMEELDNKYPEGCYAIPSSIHEMIIVPFSDEIGASVLKDMVKGVNNTEVAPCEVLTDNVYYYRNGEWEVAEA